jgi:hypothetical protein
LYRASNPELSGEKLALNYVRVLQQSLDGRLPKPVATTTG